MRSKMTSQIYFPGRRHNEIASVKTRKLLDQGNSSVITWIELLSGWRATGPLIRNPVEGQFDEYEKCSRLPGNVFIAESGVIRF